MFARRYRIRAELRPVTLHISMAGDEKASRAIRDGILLFVARFARLFAHGFLSVVLILYLVEIGLGQWQIGLLLTFSLLGDAVVSLAIASQADHSGRRRMLILAALIMLASGAVLATSRNFWLLLAAVALGGVSPSGNDIGPFRAIEQAALAHIIPRKRHTYLFAWYKLVGSFATATGAFAGGMVTQWRLDAGFVGASAYYPVLIAYSAVGLLLAGIFALTSASIEVHRRSTKPQPNSIGLHRSQRAVFRISGLIGLDAFGGGFVIQSIVAYWFHVQFDADPMVVGEIFLFANLLAGISALASVWLAKRIGLVNTMVFTHLPSNVLLILVPLMPDLTWAVTLLLLGFSISQMDAPIRHAYLQSMVSPDERSAASGVASVAHSLGGAISPFVALELIGYAGLTSIPFFLGGGIKIIYDVLLYRMFAAMEHDETSVGLLESQDTAEKPHNIRSEL